MSSVRLAGAVAVMLVAGVLAIPTYSALAKGSAPPSFTTRGSTFAISKVVGIPTFVKPNVSYPDGKYYWSGHPVFPLTVRIRGVNPANVGCGPGSSVVNTWCPPATLTTITKRENPIVLPPNTYCSGGSAGYVVGYETWFVDAKGHKSQAIRNFFYCKTS